MKRPTIFLNELSLIADRELEPQELLPCVLATLNAARETKRIRRELIVVGGLAEVTFGGGLHSLHSLLRGADYREEWRMLKGLEQSSPYDQGDWTAPSELEEVQFQGTPAVGLLRATENKSAVLSFELKNCWAPSHIQAEHLQIESSGAVQSRHINVPNFAKPEHVPIHEELVHELGMDLSSSSIIYENEDFVLRMYFNDHDPPHFHVMAHNNSSETIARFRISTLDQLSQSANLRPGIRRKIINWAQDRKDALMLCWQEVRRHRHPMKLE